MIESTENKKAYLVGNSEVFPFPIRYLDDDYIECYLEQEGKVRPLDQSEYDIVPLPESGGANITLKLSPLPEGALLTIRRQLPLVQQLDLPNTGKLPAESLEIQLDKTIMICQQLAEELGRCIKIPIGSTDSPDAFWVTINGVVETCLTSASNAATSAATAGNIAAQIAFIWTEITGDENLFDKAFATAQELMEAKGAVDAAAAAGIAGVNEASLAALDTAKTEINEAKDSSLESLDAALGSAEGSLTLKLAEAQGAAKAAEAAQSAAETAGGNAQLSANAAQSAADSAAAKAGEAAGSSSSALAAKQAAEAAKVEALAAQAAAEAAAGEAGSLVNASVTAHNANPQAHPNLMSAHNADAGAHSGTFDPAGTADSAVSAHNSAQNPHENVLLRAANPTVREGLEISGATPYIDFHFAHSEGDYTTRVKETQAGRLEIGGNLHVTGTLTNGNSGSSHAPNGYSRTPAGLVIQWGFLEAGTGDREVVFPVAFPNRCGSIAFATSGNVTSYPVEDSVTKSGFTFHSSSSVSLHWIAVGY